MAEGKHQEIRSILKQYKNEYGIVKFENVLAIPRTERLPELAKNDFMGTNMLVIGALTMALKSLNLKNGLNADQILDLSETILDTSVEDNLAFEDIMLFLQKLTRGEYEITSENLNIPKFMKLFEIYRQNRWEELNRIRDEIHTQNKVCGDTGKTMQRDELSEHFANFGSRINEMKQTIENLKMTNNSLKMDNL